MTFLVLSRSPQWERLANWLGDLAPQCVVLTSRARQAPPAGSFAAVEYVDDYSAAGTRRVALDLAERHAVSRVAGLQEADVVRAAALRHLLDLPGQTLESAIAYRDKHVMKALAADAGLRVPAMRRVTDAASAHAAAERIGYPVAVKPVDGGGSVGVSRVDGPSDWPAALPAGPLLVEEWIAAEGFLVVDGLMRDGVVTAAVPLDMGRGALDYSRGLRPVTGCTIRIPDPRYAQLVDFAGRVVAALPPVVEQTAFHLEAFATPDGLVLCEIAARVGGVGHPWTFTTATGTDLVGASLQGQLGHPGELSPGPRRAEAAFVAYPRRPAGSGPPQRQPGVLRHPAVVEYEDRLAPDAAHSAARWAAGNACSILLATVTGADVEAVMGEVMAEYEAYEAGAPWSVDAPAGVVS